MEHKTYDKATVRGKKTTGSLKTVVKEYKKAKSVIRSMGNLFEAGLEASGAIYNPFDCEYRETYIHQTPTGGDIHRCRKGKQADAIFEMCDDCKIEDCPL